MATGGTASWTRRTGDRTTSCPCGKEKPVDGHTLHAHGRSVVLLAALPEKPEKPEKADTKDASR